MPAAQVIIVAFHGDRWLPECFRTLAESGRPNQWVVVDNGGCADLQKLLGPDSSYLLLKSPGRLGFAEANNFALTEVPRCGEYVCFLNQDTRSGPHWLDECVKCLRERPEVGAVSPLLRTYDWSGWDPGFRDCVRGIPDFERETADGLADFYEVRNVTAAAVVVRSDVLQKVGPFDPVFGSYYEDFDLCRRIREAGFRIGVCGTAQVAHFSGSSTTTDAARRRRMRQILRNRAILRIRESGGGRIGATLKQLGPSLCYNLLRGLFRTPSSQPLSVQIAAGWDLLRIAPRLFSRSRDEAAWRQYLAEIKWDSFGRSKTDDEGSRCASCI